MFSSPSSSFGSTSPPGNVQRLLASRAPDRSVWSQLLLPDEKIPEEMLVMLHARELRRTPRESGESGAALARRSSSSSPPSSSTSTTCRRTSRSGLSSTCARNGSFFFFFGVFGPSSLSPRENDASRSASLVKAASIRSELDVSLMPLKTEIIWLYRSIR